MNKIILLFSLLCFGCSQSNNSFTCNNKKNIKLVNTNSIQYYENSKKEDSKLISLIIEKNKNRLCKQSISLFPNQPLIF